MSKNEIDATPCNRTCPVHQELFTDIKILINQQTTVCGDLKDMRQDIKDAIELAQDGIIQNTKDIALLKQQFSNHSDEHYRDNKDLELRKVTLYQLVGYKNRFVGALGIIAFILTVYGIKIFTGG